ncbi:serine hydrolase domain-containing protein [Isoptericola jiangsuensis]|uniref:serine hydrolase domain-containing protein n=1 Tax=Isoptericola jiangsuensis TaxID=548579 RepID=UPI003AAE1C2E
MSDVDVLLTRFADHAARRRVGVVAGHLAPDGTTTFRGAGRLTPPDGAAPDAATRFEIASITKTFTGALLARAVVTGDVSLDTPVGDLVDEVAGLGRDGVLVTLRHLATHTSGLPRAHLSTLGSTLDVLRGVDPYRDHTEAGLLQAIRAGRLGRTPGTGRQAYSNSGFGLLGIALARRAGAPWADVVRERLTVPLGLADTGTRGAATPDQVARTAVGYHRRRTPAPDWNLDALPGAGALLSTAGDQLGWADAHLRPPDGELGAALRLAVAEHAPHIGLAWQRTWRGDERPAGKDRLLWHSGGTGGFRSALVLRPDRGDAVVVLTNHSRSLTLATMRLAAAVG